MDFDDKLKSRKSTLRGDSAESGSVIRTDFMETNQSVSKRLSSEVGLRLEALRPGRDRQ